MADKYFGFGGNDSTGDGSFGNPYLTYETAVANTIAGDTCWMVDGEVEADATQNYMQIAEDRRVKAVNYRQAVQLADAGYTTMCGRYEATLAAADNPHVVDGIVFDAKNVVDWCFSHQTDAAEDLITQLHNVHFKDPVSIGYACFQLRGRQELVNCKVSGSPTTAGVALAASSSGDGNQAFDVQGLELDITGTTSNIVGINATKINNAVNTLDCSLKGVTGTVSGSGGSEVIVGAIVCRGVDQPVISNFNLTINATNVAANHKGISCTGLSVATTSNATIANGEIKFNSPSGYGIALGESTVATDIIYGLISGVKVTGKYYASDTPHNTMVGQGVTADVHGHIGVEGYVSVLLSRTLDVTAVGCLAFDCYGPSFYIKGATSATVKHSTAICSGKYVQRDQGIIAVVAQAGVNTVSGIFQEVLIIVSDISKIHSLAQIGDALQVCAFVRNTYIIPDSVDITTEQLFAYQSATPNSTLAQWNAQAEVTDDVIVQLPAVAIAALIQEYRPIQAGYHGSSRIGI